MTEKIAITLIFSEERDGQLYRDVVNEIASVSIRNRASRMKQILTLGFKPARDRATKLSQKQGDENLALAKTLRQFASTLEMK